MDNQTEFYSLPLITDFSNLPIGTIVWHPEFGQGELMEIVPSSKWPYKVAFDDKDRRDSFAQNGQRMEKAYPACRLVSKPRTEHTRKGWVNLTAGPCGVYWHDTRNEAECHKSSYARGPFKAQITWWE